MSSLGKIVRKGKEIFATMDEKINFTVPKGIMEYYGTKDSDDRELMLHENNLRFQIGKMYKENKTKKINNQDEGGETIYTKSLLDWSIKYLVKKVPKGRKMVIQIWRDLAEYLVNEDQLEMKEKIMSFDEEKEQIYKTIKENNDKNIADEIINKVEIIDVSESYPELFSLLKEKGYKGLESDQEPILDKDNINPLLIAKYLYWVTKKNKLFMEVLYTTKPQQQKEKDTKKPGENNSDYYALIEVAIRLYEVLKGIYIQGGIGRQIEYDKIIGMIINGKDSKDKKLSLQKIPELQKLHDICKSYDKIKFERIYVNNNKVKEVEKKQYERKKMERRIARTLLYTLLGIGLISAGGKSIATYSEYQKEKEKQKRIAYYENNSAREKGSQYVDYLYEVNRISETLVDEFESMYGTGKLTKEEIKLALSHYLKEYQIGNFRFNELNKKPGDKELQVKCVYDFVDHSFRNKMIENGFDTIVPLPVIQEQLDCDFLESLNYEGVDKQGYNEKDGLWYIIEAPLSIGKVKIDNGVGGSEEIGLVEGYLIPHESQEITIKVPENRYNQYQNSSGIEEIVSKSKPDENGEITIVKRILGKTANESGSSIEMIKNSKKVIFVLNPGIQNTGNHENLSFSKVKIIDYFKHKEPVIKDILKKLEDKSELERNYGLPHYFPKRLMDLKVQLIQKLYVIDKYGKNNLYYLTSNPEKIDNYINQFIQDHKEEIKTMHLDAE